MTTGAWILVLVIGLASAFGLLRAKQQGRFRGTREFAGAREDAHAVGPEGAHAEPAPPPVEDPSVLAGVPGLAPAGLGERATLLQFSSAFCAPCRATRRVLGEVAELVPGVAHLEIDAEQHLDLVRRLDVRRTPTTLVLDAAGREVSRAAGAPRKDEVLATLGRVVSS